jgi:Flp pilus assembly protein TadG
VIQNLIAFARAKKGGVAVMFALVLPVVIGFAGFGVETSYWYLKSLDLQAQADAAAYAGAMEKRSGSSNSVVTTVATRAATDNGFSTGGSNTITVNTPPATGSAGAQAVEVLLHATAERFFTQFFTNTPVNLNARAVGKYNTAANACILALDSAASKSALFSGNMNLQLTGCSVMSNSVAADAGTVQGSATLTTTCLISAGGVSVTAGLTETVCAAPITQASQVADPYKDVATPTASGSCLSDNGASLSAGHYCSGMNLKGNVTLAPGVYYVDGGDFTINANANITGTGVTIYLKSGSKVTMNGNAHVDLSAPTSGTYSGMLFFGDRSSPMAVNKFNGDSSSSFTGAIYFPTQEIDYQGNFSGSGGCTQVVGDMVSWTGSANVSVDCTAYGMQTIAALTVVKLVE